MNNIDFVSSKQKKDVYFVYTNNGILLGEISKRKARDHMHWCFTPTQGYIDLWFSLSILKKIIKFMKDLYQKENEEKEKEVKEKLSKKEKNSSTKKKM